MPPTADKASDWRAEIKELIDSGATARAYHKLADRTLESPAIYEYPFLIKQMEATCPNPHAIRIGFLSTFTLEPIKPMLRAIGFAHGFDIDAYFGPFGQFETELMNPASGLAQQQPNIVVLAWRLEDLAPRLHHDFLDCSEEELAAIVEDVKRRVMSLVDACRANISQAHLILHTFAYANENPLGVIDYAHKAGRGSIVRQLNNALRELRSAREGVQLLDTEAVARRSGPAWHDPRYWYRARAPLGPDAQRELATEYVKFARAISGKTKKVLITDLDNTLWGGILGEDGIPGIKSGEDFPGNAFVTYQRELKELSRRGIVLAINSKNNEADVKEAFERKAGMGVAWDDFVARRINWQDKAQNMRELADELSLGLDSFVFVDDNPVEVEMIRQELPEVTVVLVPSDPALLPGLLSRRGYFDSVIYSAEDRKRNEFYKAESGRRELQQSATDLESYYRSLGMKLTVYDVSEQETPRVAQLTQRTNQFNMTTRRYTETDIARFRGSDKHRVRAYRLEDKFGDNGIIAVTIAERKEDAEWIDTFLMSCRVIGRTVESSILSLVALEAKENGASALAGDLLFTKKNIPARGVYAACGFEKVADLEEGERYRLNLS
ncbi:MAG: HAD-IIIC family phosphatase, partial [Phycisphaerae bacterium]